MFARVGSSLIECLCHVIDEGSVGISARPEPCVAIQISDLLPPNPSELSANDLQNWFLAHTLSDVLLNPALRSFTAEPSDTIVEVLIATVHPATLSALKSRDLKRIACCLHAR
jgi:hypothetical protein